MKLVLAVLLFASFSFAQLAGLTQFIVVDSFGPGAGQQRLTLTLGASVAGTLDVNNAAAGIPVIETSSFTSTSFGILGGVRDLEIKVFNGLQDREFSSEILSTSAAPYLDFVFEGEWVIASPKNSASRYTIQYDSTPGLTLNTSGLGSVDFTVGGLSLSSLQFGFFLLSDLATTFQIKLYSPTGNVCTGSLNVPIYVAPPTGYSPAKILRTLSLSQFTGNCQLNNIGAVEMTLASQDALDAIIRDVSVFGPRPSATPTPTTAPSQSRTPTPAASQSRTPPPSPSNTPTPTTAPSQSRTPAPSASNTPSTSVQCSVICQCPVFTCHLLFDDDEADVIYN